MAKKESHLRSGCDRILRTLDKPIFYTVNKIDGAEQEVMRSDIYQLGIDNLNPLSAEHRYGFADLLDDVVDSLTGFAAEPAEINFSNWVKSPFDL